MAALPLRATGVCATEGVCATAEAAVRLWRGESFSRVPASKRSARTEAADTPATRLTRATRGASSFCLVTRGAAGAAATLAAATAGPAAPLVDGVVAMAGAPAGVTSMELMPRSWFCEALCSGASVDGVMASRNIPGAPTLETGVESMAPLLAAIDVAGAAAGCCDARCRRVFLRGDDGADTTGVMGLV